MFAVGIFGLVAVSTIALMNSGLASVQNALEVTMARQEIDAQAEVLRFVHDAYLTEPDIVDTSVDPPLQINNYRKLWQAITAKAYYTSSSIDSVLVEDNFFFNRAIDNRSNCNSIFQTTESKGTDSFGIPKRSFVINPRALDRLATTDALLDTDIAKILISANDLSINYFSLASTYPRLLYGVSSDEGPLSDAYVDSSGTAVTTKASTNTNLSSAEGIWVTAIASKSGLQCYDADGNPDGPIRPDFYDFYIQTCWDTMNGNASVISSTVRLFNPDQVSLKKQGLITFDNVEWEKYDNNNDHRGPCSGYDPPEHVITSGADIEFVGYTADNMDEGVRLPIDDRPFFTLDVDVDTTGILTHPGGEGLTISIGPISANLKDSGGIITNGTNTQNITARSFHLQMVREGNHYKVCADTICVEADSDATGVTIDYNFKHYGHCCSAISKAKLSNIEMSSHSTEDPSGSCVKTVPTL